jgi:LmbE family N-acetylglucosaminyl deacetylase
MRRDLPVPGRVLGIGAHPDDLEFQSGATLAKWAAGGAVVDLLVCTDGSKGTWDPSADLGALVAARQDEQRAAARALGATGEVGFLGWVDGEVELGRDRVGLIAREIRRRRPDIVLTHDPWKRYRLHPDHRTVGWLALDAVVAARDPHFFPEHDLTHHRPSTVLLFEADEPDHLEDVTGHTDAKLEALEAHRSQFRSTMGITDPTDGSQLEDFRRRVLAPMAETGQAHGVAYAELFKAITDV